MSDFNIFLTEEVKQQLREREARERRQAATVGAPAPMSVASNRASGMGAMSVYGAVKEPCDGTVDVRAHLRGEVPVRAYTRACRVHGNRAVASKPAVTSKPRGVPELGIMQTFLRTGTQEVLPLIDSVIDRANRGNLEDLPQMEKDMDHIRFYLEGMTSVLGTARVPMPKPNILSNEEVAFYTDRLIDVTVDDIIAQEGFVWHPYADTKGKETIGDGHLIETEKEFLRYRVFKMKDGVVIGEITDPKKKEEKFREIQRIAKLYTKKVLNPKTGKLEDKCTTPPLQQTEMQALGIGWDEAYARQVLKKDMQAAVVEVREQAAKHGIELFALPVSQQRQLLDCRFNMGPKFLLSTQKRTKKHPSWPKFTHHFKEHAYTGMMDEIESKDVADRRNLLRQALLARAQLEHWEEAYFLWPKAKRERVFRGY